MERWLAGLLHPMWRTVARLRGTSWRPGNLIAAKQREHEGWPIRLRVGADHMW
ncbi:MAG: hypothetical protein WCK47_13455 [bacterium]